MIQYFKDKITEGICSKLCHQIYKYAHHANQHLNQLTFQLYQNLKRQNQVHICIILISMPSRIYKYASC